jgi:hypothetical protein
MPRARARQLNLNNDDLDVVENSHWGIARSDFATYRKVIRREMLWDWWPQEVSEKLQQFYQDLKDGKRPKVAIMAPPQHGKSTAATDFITWVAGQDPNLKTIFASFSDTLGERTNKEVQRILRSDAYIKIFGRTRLDIPGWSTNTTLIEFGDFKGSFRNTTVEGSINGLELHLGVIDDPHKGRNEALSQASRDRVWNWFADDWLARFHKDAGMLAIMTRWHVDDLLGRLIERFPDVQVLRYPAIAEQDEIHVTKLGQHVRKAGEALLPAWKPLNFLMERKRTQTVKHIARGQWGAYERERQIKYWADDDARVTRSASSKNPAQAARRAPRTRCAIWSAMRSMSIRSPARRKPAPTRSPPMCRTTGYC